MSYFFEKIKYSIPIVENASKTGSCHSFNISSAKKNIAMNWNNAKIQNQILFSSSLFFILIIKNYTLKNLSLNN